MTRGYDLRADTDETEGAPADDAPAGRACPECGGSGLVDGPWMSEVRTCGWCGGSGRLKED
jgi:DnaJ-class molecular chaperone